MAASTAAVAATSSRDARNNDGTPMDAFAAARLYIDALARSPTSTTLHQPRGSTCKQADAQDVARGGEDVPPAPQGVRALELRDAHSRRSRRRVDLEKQLGLAPVESLDA